MAEVASCFDLEIAPAILPPSPPSFFPPLAVKCLLAQLLIDCIVRFTHPLAELAAIADPRRVLLHPLLEIFCAHPARI